MTLPPWPATGAALLLAGQLVFAARNALGGDLPYAAMLLVGAAGYGALARALRAPEPLAAGALAGLGTLAVSAVLRLGVNLGQPFDAWMVPLGLLTAGTLYAAWNAWSWRDAPADAAYAFGVRIGFGVLALAHAGYLALFVTGGSAASVPDVGAAFAASMAGAALIARHLPDPSLARGPAAAAG